MRIGKAMTALAALTVACGLPAVAEANGEHLHIGDLHFDPLVVAGVAVFVGLITLMFVGQWLRLSAARRKGAPSTPRKIYIDEEGEEVTSADEQAD